MSKYVISDSVLTGIADAIRDKNGSQEAIKPINMASRIEEIVTNTGAFKVQSVEEMNALTDMQVGDYCIIKGVPEYVIPNEDVVFSRFSGLGSDVVNGYYDDCLFILRLDFIHSNFILSTIPSGNTVYAWRDAVPYLNDSYTITPNSYKSYVFKIKVIDGKRYFVSLNNYAFKTTSDDLQRVYEDSIVNAEIVDLVRNTSTNKYSIKLGYNGGSGTIGTTGGVGNGAWMKTNAGTPFMIYTYKLKSTTVDHLVYQYRQGSGWVDVTDDILVPQTTITPTTSSQTPRIPDGYRGFKNITVNPVTANIDNNITPENIRAGVTILNIAGNLEPDKPDQTKIVDPTTNIQNIRPDTGYELASVTINAVTSNIDPNIIADNIRNGINILGVTGTLNEGIDTSDATAQATDIMSGMTAYVNGSKITGTIDNRRVVYKVNTYEERDALTPQVNDMCVMWNNEYLGSFLFTNNSWLEMSISEEGTELNEALNEIFGDDEPYEGMGGTDEEIEAVLDEILGEEEA